MLYLVGFPRSDHVLFWILTPYPTLRAYSNLGIENVLYVIGNSYFFPCP